MVSLAAARLKPDAAGSPLRLLEEVEESNRLHPFLFVLGVLCLVVPARLGRDFLLRSVIEVSDKDPLIVFGLLLHHLKSLLD